MATSIFPDIKISLNIRACRFFTIIILSFFLSGNVWAQVPQLIATIPASNQYPITFTDPAQRIIAIEFDQLITNLVPNNSTGWTITVGGLPVLFAGPVFDAFNHRIINFQLAVGITYANRNNVRVTYNKAGSTAIPKIGGAGGEVASFGPITSSQ